MNSNCWAFQVSGILINVLFQPLIRAFPGCFCVVCQWSHFSGRYFLSWLTFTNFFLCTGHPPCLGMGMSVGCVIDGGNYYCCYYFYYYHHPLATTTTIAVAGHLIVPLQHHWELLCPQGRYRPCWVLWMGWCRWSASHSTQLSTTPPSRSSLGHSSSSELQRTSSWRWSSCE